MDTDDRNFLIGCTLGDGCIRKDARTGSCTFVLGRAERHKEYAAWQLEKINSILGSKATLRSFMDKGKYPAVRFGASNKKLLSSVYSLLYPNNKKTFTTEVLYLLGLQELALFWMDDGSLEVRKRQRPRSVKIERSGWLAVCTDEYQADIVGNWIQHLTTARYTKVRHKSGRYYLRWHSAQCRLLINAIQPYILPCVAYKTDLNRTCSVKEWLSESQHQTLIVDNKMARAPYTQLALSKGDDIV